MVYYFDRFSINTETDMFYEGSEPVQLEPRVQSLLAYLVEHRDRIVTKEELFETLWEGRVVSDAALNTCIRSVRRALSDDAKQQRYIRTYPKRGFRFVADTDEKTRVSISTGMLKFRTGKLAKRFAIWRYWAIAAFLPLVALLIYFSAGQQLITDATSSRPRIAVLNFDNNAKTEFQTYFSVGLSEELVNSLSHYRQLFVIARNSSALVDKKKFDTRATGKQLNARYLVDGTLRYEDVMVRISARLVDTQSGQQIWSTDVDGNLTEAYDLQKELAHTIAAQLVPELDRADAEANRKQAPEQLTAWSLYHKARVRQAVYTRPMQAEAIDWALKALEKDSSLAAAYGILARAKGVLFFYQWTENPQKTLDEALGHAKRAISLDRDDPEAHAALGYIYRYTGDETSAIANLERATQLNPSDANIRLEYAHTLDWYRRQAEALPEINLAIKLSPRDPRLENMYFYKAHILFHLKRFDESLAATRSMSGVITSDTWRIYYNLIRAANFAQLNQNKKASQAVDSALAINPGLNLTSMRDQFKNSKNHPDNRKFWLESLEKAGLPLVKADVPQQRE